MPIHFRCSQCQHLLSIAQRKAGSQITCPLCGRPQAVPQAGSTSALPTGPAVRVGAPSFTLTQRLMAMALAVGILLLAGYLIWAWPSQQPEPVTAAPAPSTDPEILAELAPPAPLSHGNRDLPAEPSRPSAPAAKPRSSPPPLPSPEPRKKPAASKPDLPAAKSGNATSRPKPPPPPAEPKDPLPTSAKPAFAMKRLDSHSAEELRKELLQAPELALDDLPGTAAELIAVAEQLRLKNGVYPGPVLVAAQRPDLRGLPLRMGMDCQLGVEPAGSLQALSRKLRTVLQGCIPVRSGDPRPDPARLRVELLGKDPDNPPSWIDPDAVPALMQLLQAEDREVRKVLVEVLSRIKDSRATQALAVRAMTDLDPEVRARAVQELCRRPHKDYSSLLVAGLRYPWLPVMEHAAEALVAVKDVNAVPQLVPMLDAPNPTEPTTIPVGRAKQLLVPEMVRVNHLRNCLLCHAPSFDTNDLVRGAVPTPGKALPGPATTPAYYGGSKDFVRADVTYLRQDFSVVQPVPNAGVWPTQQRFDYLVRLRKPTPREMQLFRDKKQPKSGEPREVLLFTLRQLTGKDLGLTSAEWKKVVPEDTIQQVHQSRLQSTESTSREDWKQLQVLGQAVPAAITDTTVKHLRDELVQAPPDKRSEVLVRLRDGKGIAYTDALGLAIRDLDGLSKMQARDALAARLTRMTATTLRDKLSDDSAEIRQAAARSCGMKKASALIPDLIALLGDADAEVVQAARTALKTLTDADYGPEPDSSPQQRQQAQTAWQRWWQRQLEPQEK